MTKKILALAAIAALGVSACQTTDPYTGERKISNTAKGAAIGAAAGAVLGAITNTSDSKQTARNAMIGAGVGALGGAAVGVYMDKQEEELRKRLEGTGVGVQRVGDDVMLNMPGDVTFGLGSPDVAADFYPALSDVALVLKEYNKTVVHIDGHTDTSGNGDYNLDLSQKRANNVATYILNQGIMPERFVVVGYGETRPKVQTGDGVKEPANRRVEIWISPLTES